MKTFSSMVLAALAVASAPCGAQFYGGASALSSEYEYEDVGRGSGAKLYAGYRFEPLLLELTALDLGEPEVRDFTDESGNTFTDVRLGFRGYDVSVGWFGAPSPALGTWAKVGYYRGDATLDGRFNGAVFGTEETSDGLSFGAGLNWMFTRSVGLLLDVGALTGMKDLPQLDPSHSSDVMTASLGLVFAFGPARAPAVVGAESRGAATRSATARAAPAPAPEALPEAPPATPPAAPPVALAAPAMFAQGASHAVRSGTVLRGRPRLGSGGVPLAPDAAVQLAKRVTNPDGAWWYVEHGGARGWVLEGELRPAGRGA